MATYKIEWTVAHKFVATVEAENYDEAKQVWELGSGESTEVNAWIAGVDIEEVV